MLPKKKCNSTIYIMLLCGLFTFGLSHTIYAQTEAKAGDVINSGNLNEYEAYFPVMMQKFIKDGADGISEATVIEVKDPVVTLPLPAFVEASKKNVGKVILNPDNTITGHEAGFPFPDAKGPDLEKKAIWNFYYRWRGDNQVLKPPRAIGSAIQRKHGTIRTAKMAYAMVNLTNRVSQQPFPSLPNPDGVFWIQVMKFLQPPNKDMRTLTFRYLDDKKADDMWVYVPTLRRTIRMVSSERSNPVAGSVASWDDFFGFDGKISQFTYKLIGEEKILALMDQKKTIKDFPEHYRKPIYDSEPYEVRDAVAVEIKAKDPRYPESKREIWITRDIWYSPYAMTYDKNGELWKGCYNSFGEMETVQGEKGYQMMFNSFADFKTGYWSTQLVDRLFINDETLSISSFSPGNFYTQF